MFHRRMARSQSLGRRDRLRSVEWQRGHMLLILFNGDSDAESAKTQIYHLEVEARHLTDSWSFRRVLHTGTRACSAVYMDKLAVNCCSSNFPDLLRER